MQTIKKWIAVRKKVLQQIKSQVFLHLGDAYDSELEAFQAQFEKEFLGSWRESSFGKLIKEIEKARLILGADFHAYQQSQRSHLRILRSLDPSLPIVLGLECFEVQHQSYIDAYLAGVLTDDELLRKTKWKQRWGFDWSHYKPLLELAMNRGIGVVGLNHYHDEGESLEGREKKVAKTIVENLDQYGNSIFYVIFGEIHLAKEHLPQKLFLLKEKLRNETVRIFQNSERLYFKLLQENRESVVNVLEGTNKRYCLMSSPPWVQWQSYLMFLEESVDFSLEDTLTDFPSEDDDEYDGIELREYLDQQLSFIANDLDLRFKNDDDDIYTMEEMEEVVEKIDLSEKQIQTVKGLVNEQLSFFVPEGNFGYLSQISVNHVSEMAGLIIQAKCSGQREFNWNIKEHFEAQVWVQMLGFFSSKLVNPQRKSSTVTELKKQLQILHPEDEGREVLLLALERRFSEVLSLYGHNPEPPRVQPVNSIKYFEAAQILGQMMGEKLFIGFRQHKIGVDEVQKYFRQNIYDQNFISVYFEMIRLLSEVKVSSQIEGWN